jgi:hypothetical protein
MLAWGRARAHRKKTRTLCYVLVGIATTLGVLLPGGYLHQLGLCLASVVSTPVSEDMPSSMEGMPMSPPQHR